MNVSVAVAQLSLTVKSTGTVAKSVPAAKCSWLLRSWASHVIVAVFVVFGASAGGALSPHEYGKSDDPLAGIVSVGFAVVSTVQGVPSES